MSNSTISQLGTFSFDKKVMIGSGKFGKVYLGNDTNTNQPVCVKVFSKTVFFGENILDTICQKEIDLTKLIMKIYHENLVRIIDVVDSQESVEAYLIMELCDKTLTQWIQEKQMNKQEIIDFIYQVATGYYCLEQQNIVHRDLKPDNILIKVEKGKVIYKLADFGLGKLLEKATQETQTKYVGTAYYFAPEMVDNAFKAYKSKCDIFSFGIIIFELLVGKKTFESSLNREKLKSQPFESVFSQQLGGVDEWFKNLLSSMIIYDWTKRIGWKDLKVILDLNMNDKYKGILGKMEVDNIFFGYYPQSQQNKITVKVFYKEEDKDIIHDFQYIDSFSDIDTINAIQVYDLINKENSPLIYVIMEKVDCSLQTLMEISKFTSLELVNFIEQMTNGLTIIQRLKKKVFSLSLQNILVTKLDEKKRIFKITDYEFYETKDKSKNQSHILQDAIVQQFAWIVYQLILQRNIPYSEFLEDIQQQVKKNALLLNVDLNIKPLVSLIMIPHQSLKVIYDQVQGLKKEQKEKSKSSDGIGMGFGTINNQQKFMTQNNFPLQQNKSQFSQLQNQQINFPNKMQFNQNVPVSQQQFQQPIFQHQQIQPNVAAQNKNFIQSPQPGFIPSNNVPVILPQNQQQINQNTFGNLSFQNNNPIKFGTNKVQQFIPNQQPQQQFKPTQNFNPNPNKATNLNQNNTQQFCPLQQPQNFMFQNFNNTFLQPQQK